MSKNTVTIRVNIDTRDKINEHAEKTNMSQPIIVGYLVDLLDQHDLFDPDWRNIIAQEAFSEVLDKQYEDERRQLSLATHKQMLKTKADLLKEYVRALDREERKTFLESVLGDLKSENFLDEIVNYQLFMIDGKKRACQPDKEGKPVITGVDSSLISVCERGFHVMGAWCDCDIWRRCPMRSKEYEAWLVEHGSEADRNRYIEDQSRVRRS